MGDSMKCGGCNKNICVYCQTSGYCKSCWEKLTPEQQQSAKEQWRKGMRKGISSIFALLPLIFIVYVLPIIIIKNKPNLFLGWIIVGTVVLVISLIAFASHKRKQNGGTGVLEELRRSVQNSPKMGEKDKKLLKLVLGCFVTLILLFVFVGIAIMSDL
jgi:hypothetical protein